MGLSGYPGMMGPKGEPVSTTLSLSHKKSILAFCFSLSLSTRLLSFLDEHQGGTARLAPTLQTSSITSNGDIWK